MDKKKRCRKTFVQTWRPRNYPEAICYFCIIFCVDSMKGDAQKKTEKENRTRKHLPTPETPEKLLK